MTLLASYNQGKNSIDSLAFFADSKQHVATNYFSILEEGMLKLLHSLPMSDIFQLHASWKIHGGDALESERCSSVEAHDVRLFELLVFLR
jgi:hypothetical protein